MGEGKKRLNCRIFTVIIRYGIEASAENDLRAVFAAMLALFCVIAARTAWADDPPPCGHPSPKDYHDQLAIYLDNHGDTVSVENDAKYPGALIQFGACLVYASPENDLVQHYYIGIATIAYFDKQGKYLGSNGQALQDAAGAPLPRGANSSHLFAAGIGLGYMLKDATNVSNSVLVDVTIQDCPTPVFRASTQHSDLVWLKTKGVDASVDGDLPRPERTCVKPTPKDVPPKDAGAAVPVVLDPDPSDSLFRLYAEGLFRVSDDAATDLNPLTHLGLDACLRLIPSGTQPPPQHLYDAQALAYFFDKNGRVLGLGAVPLAIGGQQLGVLSAPKPDIFGGGPIDEGGAFHDFGVTVTAPLHNRGDIDRHVLIAVTIVCRNETTNKCDQTPHTYYRVVAACAPDLPDNKLGEERNCPDYRGPPL